MRLATTLWQLAGKLQKWVCRAEKVVGEYGTHQPSPARFDDE
jgi:hypothetical protein